MATSTVPKRVYDHLLQLKHETDRALIHNSKSEIEKIREKLVGKKEKLTLFSEIEEELDFLKAFGNKSQKKYLGRSVRYYKRASFKRIASWRAELIRADCEELIRNRQDLNIFIVALLIKIYQKKGPVVHLFVDCVPRV